MTKPFPLVGPHTIRSDEMNDSPPDTAEPGPTHRYDAAFYEHVKRTASHSAGSVLPCVKDAILLRPPESVLDVGCGPGSWVAVWLTLGVSDVLGLDRFDRGVPNAFAQHLASVDLTEPIHLGRRFDLAQCLEVAEHLHERHADTLVESICAHSDVVVFGAASPGQGGDHHVNEQPASYWREKFADRGYDAYDALRPLLAPMKHVEPWYRYNTLVYATPSGATRLSANALSTKIGGQIPNNESLAWRMRRAAVQTMPKTMQQFGAWMLHRTSRRPS